MNGKWFLALIACLSLMGKHPVSAQQIWPGDVNNNGIVNGVDLLYFGIAFGSGGPPRSELSTEWRAQPFPAPWMQNFPDGLNYAFADCDGNGFVDEDDFDDGIEDNFGLTHGALQSDGYANGQAGEALRLRLQPTAQVVTEGARVEVSLHLDDAEASLEGFYGMALKIRYTTNLLADDDGLDFSFSANSWIHADNAMVQELVVNDDAQGRMELAVTRTNQQTVAVRPGAVGNFSIVVEDIIVGLTVDTIKLWVDSVRLIGPGFQTIPIVPDSTEIIVAKDLSTVSTQPLLDQPRPDLFPNPATADFFLRTAAPVTGIRLIDVLGRTYPLPAERLRAELYHIRRPAVPPGVYLLHLQHGGGDTFQKIILLPY